MALAIDADGDGQVGFENLGHRVNDALSMIEDESMTSSQVLLPLGDDSVSEISMLLPPELARGGCQVLDLVVEEKPPPRPKRASRASRASRDTDASATRASRASRVSRVSRESRGSRDSRDSRDDDASAGAPPERTLWAIPTDAASHLELDRDEVEVTLESLAQVTTELSDPRMALRSLDLSANGLGLLGKQRPATDYEHLPGALRRDGHSHPPAPAIALVANMVARNKSITSVDLADNSAGDAGQLGLVQLCEAVAQNNRLGSLTALDLSGNVMIGHDSRRYDAVRALADAISGAKEGSSWGPRASEWIERQIPGPGGKAEPWAGKGAGGVRASGVRRMGGRLGFGAYECAGQPPKGSLLVKKDDPEKQKADKRRSRLAAVRSRMSRDSRASRDSLNESEAGSAPRGSFDEMPTSDKCGERARAARARALGYPERRARSPFSLSPRSRALFFAGTSLRASRSGATARGSRGSGSRATACTPTRACCSSRRSRARAARCSGTSTSRTTGSASTSSASRARRSRARSRSRSRAARGSARSTSRATSSARPRSPSSRPRSPRASGCSASRSRATSSARPPRARSRARSSATSTCSRSTSRTRA